MQKTYNTTDRRCTVCGTIFPSKYVAHKYCSSLCRALGQVPQHRREDKRRELEELETVENKTHDISARTIKKRTTTTDPKGYYVYGWYKPGFDLPFYVGKGMGHRAWDKHKIKMGKFTTAMIDAECEIVRGPNTRIVIYRDNLTREGALLAESILLDVFRGLGADLTNDIEAMKRQEKPPLVETI